MPVHGAGAVALKQGLDQWITVLPLPLGLPLRLTLLPFLLPQGGFQGGEQ
jgi:hypothetical protein